MRRHLVKYPVRAVWEQEDGSDAHIVDSIGNVIADGAVWLDPTATADEHRGAMVGMAMALNKQWKYHKERHELHTHTSYV